jgi:hypothetical protein
LAKPQRFDHSNEEVANMNIGEAIAAIGALGTASFGLVDAAKAFWGGPSLCGFGYIKKTMAPFAPAITVVDAGSFEATLRANWINGVDEDTQKAKAKALIHLGLKGENAAKLANAAGLDGAVLKAVAEKIDTGTSLDPNDVAVIGRFDAIVSAKLDCAYERADQAYRNCAKLLAGVAAVILACCANAVLSQPVGWWTAVLVGIVATPLAPIAKDLSSSLSAAASALTAAKV